MYAGDKKKQKSFKDGMKKKKKEKKKKKKGKPEEVPKLPMFKELPPINIKRKGRPKEIIKDPILPYANVGYKEKTTRPNADLIKGDMAREGRNKWSVSRNHLTIPNINISIYWNRY
jgi:hypothetical protein